MSLLHVRFDGDVIVAYYDSIVNLPSQDSTWIVDSVALFLVVWWCEIFRKIYVEINIECKIVLSNFEIRLKLIFIGVLDDKGYMSTSLIIMKVRKLMY